MSLDYATCRALKEAGFPQKGSGYHSRCEFSLCGDSDHTGAYVACDMGDCGERPAVYVPTLSELISGCGDGFWNLCRSTNFPSSNQWVAEGNDGKPTVLGPTPEAAVAALYLSIHGKENVSQ